MNDAPIKQPDTTTTETQPADLSEPHFDEIAVSIAQPVKPIAPPVHGRRWLARLQQPRTLLAIVFISAMMGIAALALTFQLYAQPHVDTPATEIPAEKTTAQPESPLGALTEELKSTAPRTRNRKSRSHGAKPVARRVGVIYYGSGSERP